MDWDEELKRQAAISALLAPPEAGLSPLVDESVVAPAEDPPVIEPETKSDYHKWVDQTFEPKTAESVGVGDYPATSQDKKLEPVVAEQVRDTGYPASPEDVAQVQPAPDKLDQVERATLVKFPDRTPATMPWHPADSTADLSTDLPEDVSPVIKGPTPGEPPKVQRAQPAAPRAELVQDPLVAQSIAKNIADQNAPTAPTAPESLRSPASAAPAAQTGDWGSFLKSLSPPASVSAASIAPAAGGAGTLKAVDGSRVDPTELYSYLTSKFADSGLVGYVPPDGERWGIKTGSAAEWAKFGLAVAKQESGFNTRSFNASDPGGSAGIFQFGQGQTQFTKGGNQFDPQESADSFVRSVQHYLGNNGSVADLGATFGSIRRPNEAGQYIPWAQGVAAGAPAQGAAAKEKMPWDDWVKLSPADQAAAEKTRQTREQTALASLPEAKNSNIVGLYKRLEAPVPGLSDQSRSQTQAQLKTQIVAQMREKFPELKTDDAAWAEAQKDTGPLEVGREWGSKVLGSIEQFGEPMKKGAADTDKFSVDQFLSKVMPNASDADRHAYLTKLYAMPLDQRTAEIESSLGPGFVQPGNPYRDPYFLSQALDRLADPNFQKRQADDVAKFQADMKKNVSSDPRLADTGMERIVNDTAQIPAAVAAFSNPALWPVALAQVHDQVSEGFKKEHPEWDAKTLQEKSTYATLTQFFGGLAAGKIMSSGAGILMEGIEGKAQRAIAQAIFGGTSQAAVGGLTQAATNVIAGDPLSKGTGEAALSGLIQGGVTGVVHGAGELMAPKTERAPVEHAAPEPAPAEPAPAAPRPVTHADILGPDAAPEEPKVPWYQQPGQRPLPGQDPLVIRGAERTTWTPEELARAARELPPARLREMQHPTGVHLGEEDAGLQQARDVQAVPRPLNVAEAIRQQRADAIAAKLSGTPLEQAVTEARVQPPGSVPPTPQTVLERTPSAAAPRPGSADAMTGHAGVEEPWVSGIANKYAQERMAAGEIGHVEPGTGKTTEELLAQGLRMKPEEVTQHMSDIMSGKGDPVAQTAAMRAEEARLSHLSHAASLAAEAAPNDPVKQAGADNALKNLTDLYNGPMKKLKQNWHRQGVAFQDRIPIDLSTYNGIRAEYIKSTGKTAEQISKAGEAEMRKASKQVRDSGDKYKASMQDLSDTIKNDRRRLPTIDQVAEDVMKIMKNDPCPT